MALTDQLPIFERPRERLIQFGADALSLSELIAILIRTGNGTQQLSSIALAQKILQSIAPDYATEADTLIALRTVSVPQLMNVLGCGEVKAAAIVAAINLGKRVYSARIQPELIESPAQAAQWLLPLLQWETQEKTAILILNIKHQILGKQILTVGSRTQGLICFKTLFHTILQYGIASRFIIAHNHPSGSPDPSEEDIQVTKELLQACRYMTIPCLDHIIVGGNRYISMKETTSLWHLYSAELIDG